MKCKWYADFEGVCTNGECAYRGDTCPTSESPEACMYSENEFGVSELVQILRCCARDDYACDECPANFDENLCEDKSAKRQAADMLEKLAAEKDAQKPEWISVKDRLPKAGKILVTDGETVTISNGAWLYRTLDGKIRVPANYGAGLTVTHWMPRPVPPKEETHD